MSKVTVSTPNNDFCPQTLFLYGTYLEDGTPNFGLFCWISYLWDSELGVMCCIGGSKLTQDRIRATGVFSANLVTEAILPLADYFGGHEGYSGEKRAMPVATEQGRALNVPLLTDSPVNFELRVFKTISLDDGEVYLCKIASQSVEEALLAEDKSLEERLRLAAPVRTTCQSYFSTGGRKLAGWGAWKDMPKA